MSCGTNRLSICRLGLALGFIWGMGVLILGIVNLRIGYGTEYIRVMSNLYIGYMPTYLGAFIGAAWGFVHMFIVGALVAWVYNGFRCSRGCGCCCHHDHNHDHHHDHVHPGNDLNHPHPH